MSFLKKFQWFPLRPYVRAVVAVVKNSLLWDFPYGVILLKKFYVGYWFTEGNESTYCLQKAMHVAQNLHFNIKGILFLFHDDCFCLKGKPLIFQQNLFVMITPQKTCQCRIKEAF